MPRVSREVVGRSRGDTNPGVGGVTMEASTAVSDFGCDSE